MEQHKKIIFQIKNLKYFINQPTSLTHFFSKIVSLSIYFVK